MCTKSARAIVKGTGIKTLSPEPERSPTLSPSPDYCMSTSKDLAVKAERSEPKGTLDRMVARASWYWRQDRGNISRSVHDSVPSTITDILPRDGFEAVTITKNRCYKHLF
jgi:hypothetical protein